MPLKPASSTANYSKPPSLGSQTLNTLIQSCRILYMWTTHHLTFTTIYNNHTRTFFLLPSILISFCFDFFVLKEGMYDFQSIYFSQKGPYLDLIYYQNAKQKCRISLNACERVKQCHNSPSIRCLPLCNLQGMLDFQMPRDLDLVHQPRFVTL